MKDDYKERTKRMKDDRDKSKDRKGKQLEAMRRMEKGIVAEDDDMDMEWGVGKINREDKEIEKRLLEDDKNRGYHGRSVDDDLLNEMWKKRRHWDDPFAHVEEEKERKKKKKAKEYTGHWPPNRFNIAPGYKWDGVDRSNGFEKRLLQQARESKEVKRMEYIDSDDDI